jgi:excisionase family DNA binding protein
MSDKDAMPLTITVSEAARRLGIGRSAAYQAVALKQIPTVRIGRLLRVPIKALERKVDAAGDTREKV